MRQLFTAIAGIFRTPAIWTDVRDRRRAAILNTAHLFVFFSAFIYLAVPKELLNGQTVFVVLMIGYAVLGSALLRTGHLAASAFWTTSVVWLVFAVGSLTEGGIASSTFAGTSAIVVLAGLIYGLRGALIFAGASIVVGGLSVWLIAHDLLPPPAAVYTPMNIFSDFVFYLTLTALFAGQAISSIDSSSRRVEEELRERRRVEAALRESEERLHGLYDNTTIGLYRATLGGEVLMANPAAIRMLGYETFEEMRGHSRVWGEQARDESRTGFQEILERNGTVSGYESSWKRRDGSTMYMRESASATRSPEGKILYYDGTLEDISERKQAEEALRKSERENRAIVDSVPDLLFRVNREGVLLDFRNPGGGPLFAPPGAFLGKKLSDVLPPDVASAAMGEIGNVFATGAMATFEYNLTMGDGIRSYECRIVPLSGGEVLSVIRDVTERRRAEGELLKLRKAVDTSGECIFMTDRNGVISFINPEFTRLYGYTAEEVVGRVTPRILKSGEMTPREYERFWKSILSRQVVKDELVNRTKDGRLLIIEASINPILDERGEIAGFLAIQRDITERTRVEAKRLDLERQLLHSQKLESLGVLAGGIAHDFNNLLTAMIGNLELALNRFPAPGAKERIEKALQATRRAGDLTREMLAYSGRGRFVITLVDINAVVRENAALLRSSIPHTVSLSTSLPPGLPAARADQAQIQQVVMNLITNASEAIGENTGVITVSSGVMECDRSYLAGSRIDEKASPGRYLYLDVSDTGSGMTEDVVARMFDPFFSTKSTGRGLGMSAVLGIVRGHGGAIMIDSRVGKGTTVRVLLPASDSLPVAEEAGPAESARPSPVAGTLLVVDDEEEVRELAKEFAEEIGLDALCAANGEEALALYRDHKDEIACVLLDLTMPKMDGVETFARLREIRPDVSVLLSSGYDEEEVVRGRAITGLAGFLQKPYRLEQLREKITEILRAKGT
ncbi:MAG TPA: PAS domain S-box protein [Bacteroidota bacterium]|nr:PAS domain S-box protein [Bacteroidota bacterium]